jgi:2-octaprenyl-6-methoxyphenol hydroxylase
MLEIAAHEDRYEQQAIILNCTTEIEHAGRAFERFTPHGALAFLPLTFGRVAVVWTLAHNEAGRVSVLDEDVFRLELQAAFGNRLGRITRIGTRAVYPLARVRSAEVVGKRAVLIGSAAVNLHPVAGQGFNLALRDVASLAEIFTEHLRSGTSDGDPGSPRLRTD